jgi:SAM-dependent methyltransferase
VTDAEPFGLEPIGIETYLPGKRHIFDVGTGPKGSHWWGLVEEGAEITGIDSYFFPEETPNYVSVYRMDASQLSDVGGRLAVERHIGGSRFRKERVDWLGRFDLVVANHVLEHVDDVDAVVRGISRLLQPGGIVYAGFPDSEDFTDIFYHLIHAEGGGHVQLLTRESVLALFGRHGFELVTCNHWPDDWLWLQRLYDYRARGIVYMDQRRIDYLADVFRKELTPERGYFYGWEMVFQLSSG